MPEKNVKLSSLRNIHIPTNNFKELNKLKAKLVWNKIGVPLGTRTETRNLDGKFDWKQK